MSSLGICFFYIHKLAELPLFNHISANYQTITCGTRCFLYICAENNIKMVQDNCRSYLTLHSFPLHPKRQWRYAVECSL